MAVYVSNITIPCGADFDQTFTLEDVNGIPLDLTGYTGIAALKKHPASLTTTALFDVSFPERITGKVTISLASTVTSSIRPGRYSYDVLLNNGNKTSRVVEGSALVTASSTSTATSPSYSSGTTGSQGPQGAQGAQGAQGPIGIGETGVQGAQGAQGATGAQGSQGPPGEGSSGIQINQNESPIGVANTIDFSSGFSVSFNSGITTVSKPPRIEITEFTGEIGAGASTNINFTSGLSKYALLKATTSTGAWVVIYTDETSRTNDETRSIDIEPASGAGIIANFITTGIGQTTQKFSPAVIGYNDDTPVSNTIYAKVYNNSGETADISVTLLIEN